MTVLTIVPARSGSKRVPGKNTRLLEGKPLLAYTILAALEAGLDEVMVSTESQIIAEIAGIYGAKVPWLRPGYLAEDQSEVIDAVVDVLHRYRSLSCEFKTVILLQPTSPFRKPESIRKALDLHQQSGQSVVSVSPSHLKPSWCRDLDEEGNLKPTQIFNESALAGNSSQMYVLNGSIYIASVEHIERHQSFYSEPTKAFIMEDPKECIDIDTPHDWALAEKLVKSEQLALS